MPSCIICNTEGAKLCQGCHSANYSSKQCQTKDFPTHKLLCSTFQEYQDKPHEHMRRGIIFHEMEKPPQWVWIESESMEGSQRVILEPYLKASSHSPTKVQYILTDHNHSRRRALHDTLAIIYCNKDVHGGLSLNRSIQALGNGATVSPWYGPVIVMKKLGLETNHTAYGDMELTAYPNAVDSLVYDVLTDMRAVSGGKSNMQSLSSAATVQGVRISCRGDIRVLGARKYIPVDVSVLDPVFVAEKPTSSELLGVPVRVRKIPPHPAWKDSGVLNIYENQVVTRLFRCMDPEEEGFGLAPVHWDLGIGSVLVVHKDGKDITPPQVEALCYWNAEHIWERFQYAMEHLLNTESRVEWDKLLALFTPEEFRNFFEEFKAKKEVDDASWMSAVSPV